MVTYKKLSANSWSPFGKYCSDYSVGYIHTLEQSVHRRLVSGSLGIFSEISEFYSIMYLQIALLLAIQLISSEIWFLTVYSKPIQWYSNLWLILTCSDAQNVQW